MFSAPPIDVFLQVGRERERRGGVLAAIFFCDNKETVNPPALFRFMAGVAGLGGDTYREAA